MNDYQRPQPEVQASPSGQPGVNYWKLAWSHKLFLIVFLILGAIGGTIQVILKIPVYKAATIVELVGFNQSFMNMSQVDPQAGTDTTTASASNIQTQTRILTSRSLLARTAERVELEIPPVGGAPTSFFGKLRARLPFAQTGSLEQSKEAVARCASSASARGVGATRLIEIDCESTSAEVAAAFVNALAAEHISQNLAARSGVTQRTSEWMTSQLEEAKARLQESGEKLREFVRQSGVDFFPDQATVNDRKLSQLQADVAGIQADRIAKQAKWESAKSATLEILPDIVPDPELVALKQRIIDLRREMAQFTATLTPEHYKVQRVQAQIAETEQAFEKEKAGVLKRLESDYNEAVRHEKLLKDAYSSQTRVVTGQTDKAAQYLTLKRDVDMAQQVYGQLLQESNQAALVALVPTSNIQVVDPAIPVWIPSSPRPTRDIPMGALVGGGIGYVLLWLAETRQRKMRAQFLNTPGHARVVLGVPELGVIPSAASSRRMLPPVPFRRIVAAHNGTPRLELASWQDKSSSMAESVRQTLASILRSKPTDHNPVYVITSVGPGEGKTTLSANLAIAMAHVGQRVLLVDADFRRARMHALFEVENGKGLSDLLTVEGPANLDEFIHSTRVENLKLMTHGLAKMDTPALLFFSPEVKRIGAALREKFDIILLDTAPALPFPDARLWGRHADGVVLVVRAGVTSQQGAMQTCQMFQEDGIPVLGTILNDWMGSDGANYGYYRNYAYKTLEVGDGQRGRAKE
jgi:capsular exopolysaccharide synthesis family protein